MTRWKVLLVDDSEVVLHMERMLLRKIPDVEILVAHDGLEAVETARREKPDLMLLDLMMPRMNGFEAAERILEDPQTASTPIIMVTTKGEEENVERAMTIGCSDYVYKPIDSAELIAKIRDLLGAERV